MTRVCCSCGWFVFSPSYKRGVPRCHCGGLAVELRRAKRALGATRDLDVINASPERRMRALSVR